jgi:hypothetical protein
MTEQFDGKTYSVIKPYFYTALTTDLDGYLQTNKARNC